MIISLVGGPLDIFLVKSQDMFISLLNKRVGKFTEDWSLSKYKASPIPSGGLEVPLLLKFKCDEKWVLDAMEEFVNNFYLYDFAGNLVDDKDEDDESEIDFDIAIEEGKEEEEEIGSSNNENEKEEEERLRKELLSDGQYLYLYLMIVKVNKTKKVINL